MAILLLAFLIGVVRGLEDKHSGDTSFGRPNFDAKSMPMVDNQGNPTGGHRMVLTLLDQETTRITRVVFNGRVSSEKCDFTGVAGAGIFAFANGSGFPCEAKPDDQGCEALDQSELKQGDKTAFALMPACGDEIISAEIFTNRGSVSYAWNEEH